MREPVRILVVDDHPLFRQGVVLSLNASAEFTVVGEAGSGEEALAFARELLPDIALLDISMPGVEWPDNRGEDRDRLPCDSHRAADGIRRPGYAAWRL